MKWKLTLTYYVSDCACLHNSRYTCFCTNEEIMAIKMVKARWYDWGVIVCVKHGVHMHESGWVYCWLMTSMVNEMGKVKSNNIFITLTILLCIHFVYFKCSGKRILLT